MPCGCHKKGSGGKFLSGVTWKGYGKGGGLNFAGSGLKKRRRRRKKASGVSFVGSGLRKRRKKKLLDSVLEALESASGVLVMYCQGLVVTKD